MRIIFILIIIISNWHFLYAQNFYNLNKNYRIIKKFDNILSSDGKEYIFYINASYSFSEEGKYIYSNSIYTAQKMLEKDSNNVVYNGIIKSNTPPENFIALLINRNIYNYISKYNSKQIDNFIKTDLQQFYNDIREDIIKTQTNTGYFKSIIFITKEKYKFYTGKT